MPKTKGQFYKLINEKLQYVGITFERGDYERGFDIVEGWIDEAKKEFPRMNPELFNIKNPTNKQIKKGIYHTADVNFERFKWFLKWFGK